MADKGSSKTKYRIATLILCAVVAGAPFPFGSTSHTAIAFWCGVLGVALLFASPRDLTKGHYFVLVGVGVIIAAYGFVLHEQLSETPWIATPHPIWAKASAVLDVPIKPLVTIVRDEPFYALGAPLACVLALMCGLLVATDRDQARLVLQVLAWSGGVYAAYGIVSLLVDPTILLWREKTAYVGNLTGTFINRNTAATYFGSCSTIWLLLMLQRVRERLPKGSIVWKKVPEQILTDTHPDILVRFTLFFVCLTAMFMTSSRAGVTISLLGMVGAFIVFFRHELPRGKTLFIAIAAAGSIALILLEFLGGNVGARFDSSGLADLGRIEAYRSTLRMIADRPWFGTGLGTFAWAFPPYRSPAISMYGVWDRAHSTPLELAEEMGIPIALLVGICWLTVLGILWRGVTSGRRRDIIPLGALTVALIALLHSLVDFSLQIPGYAIVVFALIGMGLACSLQSRETVPNSTMEAIRDSKGISTARTD
jgi:O-antigen ligase